MRLRWMVSGVSAVQFVGSRQLRGAFQAFTTLIAMVSVLACFAARRSDGGQGLLPEGEKPPVLTGETQRGRRVELRPPLAGYTLVYFYPKDGTPGCTEEACAFRDAWDQYLEQQVALIGVSSDDSGSHAEFSQEHALPFELVADTDGSWGRAFGVSSIVGLYSRVSFLLAPDGRVVRIYPDVEPGLHAQEVLQDVHRLRVAR